MDVQLDRHSGGPPEAKELEQHLRAEARDVYGWSNGPGERYAVHSHNYEKVLYCVSGSIRFVLPDQVDTAGNRGVIDLAPGDCMVLPAGVRHSAQVGSHGVTCLEAAR